MKKLLFCGAALAWAAVVSLAGAAEVARWSLEEGMGTTTADSVGGFNGTLTGGATWTGMNLAPVPTGTTAALTFDGTSGFVDTAFPGIGGSAARTISMWIRTTDTGPNTAMLGYGDATTNGAKWHMRVNNASAQGKVGALRTEVQGGNIIGVSNIATGDWHHVVTVLPAGGNITDAVHYVDGRRENITGAVAQAVNTNISGIGNSQPFTFGKAVQTGSLPVDRFFNGSIDEVRIFDHALAPAEVRMLFNGTTAPQGAWSWDGGDAPVAGQWQEKHQLIGSGLFNVNLGSGVSHDASPSTSHVGISGAYTFDGTAGATGEFSGVNLDSTPDLGSPTTNDFSYEVWFRPDGAGQQVLAELGGATQGTSLTLDGNTLQFRVKDNANVQTLTADISGLGGDFIQALGVIDIANGGDLSLYLNGELADSVFGTGIADWAGGNALAFGSVGGGSLGGDNGDLTGFGNFLGQLALANFYTEALTAEDVLAQFQVINGAVIPEPGSILGWAVAGLVGLAAARRARRRKKEPRRQPQGPRQEAR